jgi:hypothetical protein
MKNKKLVTILLYAIVGGAVVVLLVLFLGNRYIQTKHERQAKQIIHSFMEAEGMNIQPNTEEYTIQSVSKYWRLAVISLDQTVLVP